MTGRTPPLIARGGVRAWSVLFAYVSTPVSDALQSCRFALQSRGLWAPVADRISPVPERWSAKKGRAEDQV